MTPTEQKWIGRVSGWRTSGLSAPAFAAGKEFTAGGLRHWAHVLKKRGLAGGAAPALVRVARVDRSPGEGSSSSLTIEIGAARVRVPSGFDEATVRAVVDALVGDAQRSAR